MRLRHAPERVALPLLLGLAVRLALVVIAAPHPERFQIEDDSAEYVRLGTNLAAGHGYSQAAEAPFTPDVRRTPLYPAVLAAVFAIPAAGVRAAALLGVAASVLTIAALVRVTAVLAGSPAATAAGLLLAIDLSSAAYATQILSEPLFALLLVASLLPLLDRRVGDAAAGVSSGVLAGLAALCRPIAILMTAALVPACRWRAPESYARVARLFAIAAVVSSLFIAGWTIRNHRAGGVSTFTSLAATNMYFHRAAYIAARMEGRRVEDVRDEWQREFAGRAGSWTEAARLEWLNQHGRDMVIAHPVEYGAVFVSGIGRMLSPDAIVFPELVGVRAGARAASLIRAAGWFELVVVYALAAYGLWRLRRVAAVTAAIPTTLIAYFLLVGGPEMYPRFRVPLMPLFCMLAGIGVAGVSGARAREAA